MNDHLKFMAEHVVNQLNALGIVKDSQMNNTVKSFVAEKMREYCVSNKIELKTVQQ